MSVIHYFIEIQFFTCVYNSIYTLDNGLKLEKICNFSPVSMN